MRGTSGSINRAPDLGDEIDWEVLGGYSPFETLPGRSSTATNVGKESYFDSMTHFDFKTLLPALLQVEDRVSMAHGLESRVPLLDHALVELAATIPADIKFKDGHMKHVCKRRSAASLPDVDRERTDKMGFPVPLHEWLRGRARRGTSSSTCFSSRRGARTRARRQPARCSPSWTQRAAVRPQDLGPAVASSSGSGRSTTGSATSRRSLTKEALA